MNPENQHFSPEVVDDDSTALGYIVNGFVIVIRWLMGADDDGLDSDGYIIEDLTHE